MWTNGSAAKREKFGPYTNYVLLTYMCAFLTIVKYMTNSITLSLTGEVSQLVVSKNAVAVVEDYPQGAIPSQELFINRFIIKKETWVNTSHPISAACDPKVIKNCNNKCIALSTLPVC